jgi:hypothetical protein
VRVTDNNSNDGGNKFSGDADKIIEQAGMLTMALATAAASAIDSRVGVVALGERILAAAGSTMCGYLVKDGLSVEDAQRVTLTAMKAVSQAIVRSKGAIKEAAGEDNDGDDEDEEDGDGE